eukprot:1030426-Heterocapsa_arctica.AAC.1
MIHNPSDYLPVLAAVTGKPISMATPSLTPQGIPTTSATPWLSLWYDDLSYVARLDSGFSEEFHRRSWFTTASSEKLHNISVKWLHSFGDELDPPLHRHIVHPRGECTR